MFVSLCCLISLAYECPCKGNADLCHVARARAARACLAANMLPALNLRHQNGVQGGIGYYGSF